MVSDDTRPYAAARLICDGLASRTLSSVWIRELVFVGSEAERARQGQAPTSCDDRAQALAQGAAGRLDACKQSMAGLQQHEQPVVTATPGW